MADIQTLTTALRNAHNAGDTAAAQRIAQMIRDAQSQQAPAPEAKQEPSLPADVAKSGASGLIQGTTGLADLPGMLFGKVGQLGEKAALALGASPEFAKGVRMGAEATPLGGGDVMRRGAETATGGFSEYQPETTAGKYTQTASQFVPGAIATGGAGAANLMRFAALPGLASEAAGQATEGTALEPYARTAAALLAPTAPAFARRIISPFGGVSAERLAMAKTLEDAGVPLTAGQKTGSETLRRIEGRSMIAGAKAGAQQEAFTKAALKTIGEDASAATPEVLERAAKRIGSVFDDVVSGVDVVPDANTLTKSSGALEVYRQLTPAGSAPPIFNNINKELVRSFRSGNAIPAATVKNWRSTVSKLTRSSDAATREAAIEMMDVIDDTFNAALKAAGKPEAIAKLGEARGQWRNLLAIESAASRAGEGTAQGILSPSQLRNAVVQQGRSAFVRGKRGDIGDLTRAAEGVMKPLPTTEAGGLRDVRGISELVGAGAGASVGGPLGAVIGAAAPQVGRELAATSPIQAYLANQRIAPGSLADRRILGLMPGLLSQ